MEEKNALITGASRGIGRAIAIDFARAGYNLSLICKNNIESLEHLAKELSFSYGITCNAYRTDVSKSSEVDRLFENVAAPDVLINNAGISYVGLLDSMTNDDWMNVINTNLSSVFYTCRSVIPHMVHNKSGCIINISSVWGECGASTEVAYSASKGGVNAFTKALAKELAPSGIRVNAISCGFVDTEMNSHLSAEEVSSIIDSIPANRIATPYDISKTALMLAGATNYMTGQIIRVDGGWI